MGFMTPEPSPATPAPADLPKPPEAKPPAQTAPPKPGRKSMQTSFLGPSSVPQGPSNVGGKSLLGQ